MISQLRRLLPWAATAAAAVAVLATPAGARQVDEADRGYIAVINSEIAPVRAGADEGYYSLARLNRGQMVQVIGEKHEWAQVRLVGPAFKDLFGFIKFEKAETGRLRVASDGRAAVTLGLTPVYAPNFAAGMDARDSWKTLITLESGATVTVLETFETELDRIYKVTMPPAAAAFISLALVDRATPAQIDEWKIALAEFEKPTLAAKDSKNAENKPAAPPTNRENVPAEVVAAAPIAPAVTPRPDVPPRTEVQAQRPTVQANTAPLAIDPPPAAPVVRAAPALDATPEETLAQLDAALKRLASEPLETAEVAPLRNLYQDLARRAGADARIRRYAEARAAQLEIWADLQEQRRNLDAVRTRVQIGTDQTTSTRFNFEATGRYTAVGRVVASSIYNGQGLPRLLRLQDPATGRTLAYLRSTRDFDLIGMLGQLIGVTGKTQYDPGLRLQIIEPTRVDILAPQKSSL